MERVIKMFVTSPKVPRYLRSGQEMRCHDDGAMRFLLADRSMVTEFQAAATVLTVTTASQPAQGNTNHIDAAEAQVTGNGAVWLSHLRPHATAGWQQSLEQ